MFGVWPKPMLKNAQPLYNTCEIRSTWQCGFYPVKRIVTCFFSEFSMSTFTCNKARICFIPNILVCCCGHLYISNQAEWVTPHSKTHFLVVTKRSLIFAMGLTQFPSRPYTNTTIDISQPFPWQNHLRSLLVACTLKGENPCNSCWEIVTRQCPARAGAEVSKKGHDL